MNNGDKARVVNLSRLRQLNDERMIGDIVTIQEDVTGERGEAWRKPGEVVYRVYWTTRGITWNLPDTCLEKIEDQQKQERKQKDEMKIGDRVLLININELRRIGLAAHFNMEGFIQKCMNNSMNCIVDIPTVGSGYFVPLSCIQVLSSSDIDPGAGLKEGNTAFINAYAGELSNIGLQNFHGSQVTLLRRLNAADLSCREHTLHGANAWWVNIHHAKAGSHHEYYMPEAWLTPLRQQTETETKTETKKEQNSMNPINITITTVPSVIAQQGGAKEEVIAQGTELADTNSGATAIVAAKNAEAILAAAKTATIKVYCASAGNPC